jgi:iron complex transport system substrate-binding protein
MLKLIIYGETQRYWKCILAFEVILEKRNKQNSGFGDFSSLKQMSDSNPHYQNLNHLKIKKYIRTL